MYERNSVMVQWIPAVDKSVMLGFTLPNGETLVHVSPDLGLHPLFYTVWAYHPLNPWFDRFNAFIHLYNENGIARFLKKGNE